MIKLPRHAEIWLPGYLLSRWQRHAVPPARRVWVAVMDHFEPFWRNQDEELARERVQRWTRHWPEIARRHPDSTGRPAQYCFFYPEEEYRPHLLELLAGLVRAQLGDVEVHLHHDLDTEAAFRARMERYLTTLANEHGLLRRGADGQLLFGFIHGNWCLDNSRPDGRYCGLNNEISLLCELGCYADFTMPSGGSPTQSRQVNSIYWADDDPQRPKSYDRGRKVKAGVWEQGGLLMVPGPLGLRWDAGRWVPRLEAGELAAHDLPNPSRVARWLDLAPQVGHDIFLKLHAHGTQEKASAALLDGGGLARMFALLGEECARRGLEWRSATAWEMRQAVESAACGSGP